MKRIFIFLVALIYVSFQLTGCGGGSTGTSTQPTNPVTPTVTVTPASSSITTAQSLGVTIAVSGSSGTPTGSVALSSGSYTSSSVTLSSGSATVTIPAGSLAAGAATLTATYTPDSASSSAYAKATGTASVTVTPVSNPVAPTVTETPASSSITTAQSLAVTIAVSGPSGTPTGSVALSSGSYTSSSVTLSSGSATITIPAGSLAAGADTLTATYTPDASSSSTYASATGTASVTVTQASSGTSVSVNIDTQSNRHQISPYIYGENIENAQDVADLNLQFSRLGGNEMSDYNWKLHTYNAAADWFFEDYRLNDASGNAVDSVQYITNVQNAGSRVLTTMPMLGWVAQASGVSFPVSTYGAQCKTDPSNSNAGDGLETDCKTPVTTAAVTSAYYPLVDTPSDCPSGTADGTTCIDRQSWAQALAAAFNGSSATCQVPYSMITSCHFYDMDNEPDIWSGSHRDVHPVGTGYNELANDFETEAANVRTWDPAAVRFGPVFCCWWFYWNAATDNNNSDIKSAHGNVDFLPWWLNQVYWMDKVNGARTLDVFDVHAYADCGPTTNFTNAQLQAATVACPRFYWDPATVNADTNNTYTTNEEPNPGMPFVIPRLKAMVNAIYPGTPLSFTEWGAGLAANASTDFSTAIADADTLGVFGRERLSFASRWGGPTSGTPEYLAWKLFTNYDGNHDMFDAISVADTNNAKSSLFTSYAALNAAGTQMTIMVINKDPNNAATVGFNMNGFSATTYVAYTLSSAASSAIAASNAQSWSATQSFAPYSITLLVVSGTESAKPTSEWYLNPDDLMVPASGTATLSPALLSGTAQVTLTSAVFDAYEGAAACNGTLTLTTPTITATQPAAIAVTAGSTPGFCHYTVTGSDSASTQTQGGWIVVGNPPATLAKSSGDAQSGTHGTALANPLTVTLSPGQSGGSATGANILFTTSAGTLSNGTSSGTSVIATTNASGVASVTLTLPATAGSVTVTAQEQIVLGAATVSFTETAN